MSKDFKWVEDVLIVLLGCAVIGVAAKWSYDKVNYAAHKRTEFTLVCDKTGGSVARMADSNYITAFCIKDGKIEGVLQ